MTARHKDLIYSILINVISNLQYDFFLDQRIT